MSIIKEIKSCIKKINNPHYLERMIELLKRKAIYITDIGVLMRACDEWSSENCESDYHSFLAQYSNGFLGETDFILNAASCCKIENNIVVNALTSYARYAELLAEE